MRTYAGPGSAAVLTVTSSRRESSCATALTCRPWPSLKLGAAPAELAAISDAHADSASASAIERGLLRARLERLRALVHARPAGAAEIFNIASLPTRPPLSRHRRPRPSHGAARGAAGSLGPRAGAPVGR